MPKTNIKSNKKKDLNEMKQSKSLKQPFYRILIIVLLV